MSKEDTVQKHETDIKILIFFFLIVSLSLFLLGLWIGSHGIKESTVQQPENSVRFECWDTITDECNFYIPYQGDKLNISASKFSSITIRNG
jgi:hypothetical protein